MIDLHLHLDGSLRPATVRELLNKTGKNIFASDEEAAQRLKVADDCRDLNEYLDKFMYPLAVLQNEENIERAVYELGLDLHNMGVEYAEIRFAPSLSTQKGLNENAVTKAAINGAIKAEKECMGLKLGLILCCMRGNLHEANFKTIETAGRLLGDHVCALDLAGAEAMFSTDMFEEEFRLAARKGIPFTIHAGEAAGPESIWKALEFGASRIGHGIRCIEDNTLVDYLARHEIPLEVCPTSNMQTKVFHDIKDYPIKEILLRGVHVTLNTDNMTVSGTNLSKERAFVSRHFDMTPKDLLLMEQYSRKAAFLHEF